MNGGARYRKSGGLGWLGGTQGHGQCHHSIERMRLPIFSPWFDIMNGVKQGGVLSPVLFCVYMDDLLTSLKCAGYGCYVDTIRYDTRYYFNVRSKADISQLNLPHGTDN